MGVCLLVTHVDVPGARLYVERAGEGSPLLSISGSGSALAQGISPSTLPLRRVCDTVGWDHRGLGESEDLDPGQPTMTTYAADALALADSLGWQRFSVFGVSFGGMVAQHLAALAPERVDRLLLVCTSSGGPGGSSYPLHERPTDMAALIDTRPETHEAIRSLLGAQVPREPGYTRQLEARRRHDAWDLLPTIPARTHVMSGRYDGIAPPRNGELLAERVPGAELRLYEGGHGFLWQDPAAWSDALELLTEDR